MPASADSRVFVITGANRGLGLEWVRQLSSDPKNFIIGVVRNPDAATELKPFLGDKVVAIKGDAAKPDTFAALAKEIEAVSGGKIDVLINNAGVMTGTGAQMTTGISKSTPDEWISQYEVNVVGPVFLTIALLPLVQKSSEKKVFNIGSMLGDIDFHTSQPYLHYSSYASSKIGLTMATLKFHHEFKDTGVTFITLNPGWVQTDIAGPGGNSMAPLLPDQSVSRMLTFVNKVTFEDSGKFFSLDGIPHAAIA